MSMDYATSFANAFLPQRTRPDLCSIYEPPEPTEADKGQSATGPYTALIADEPCLFYVSQGMLREGATANQVQEGGDFRIEIRYDAPLPSGEAIFRIEPIKSALVVTGATNAEPIVLTVANHGLRDGDRVSVRGVKGNTAANGKWSITAINANSFSLDDSEGNAAYISGGLVRVLFDYQMAGVRDGSYASEKVFDLKRVR